MAWGAPGVTHKLRATNGISTVPGATQTSNQLQQAGILQRLQLLVTGSTTTTANTGTVGKDVLGPWNDLTLLTLTPSQQNPIYQVSGIMAYLIMLARSVEELTRGPDFNTGTPTDQDGQADVFAFATGTAAAYRHYLNVPVSQYLYSTGGEIGMFPLNDAALTMTLQYMANVSGTAPFNLYSTTAGNSPFLTTGNATATIANMAIEIYRDLYAVPANPQDAPVYNAVSTWIEESPQGASVASATSLKWLASPLSGLLARLLIFVWDSSIPNGVAASNLSASNAINLTYDYNLPKVQESGYAAQVRQQEYYGMQLPQGAYFYDFLGKKPTLMDVMNTFTTPNINLQMNFANALGSASFAKIARQIISPLVQVG